MLTHELLLESFYVYSFSLLLAGLLISTLVQSRDPCKLQTSQILIQVYILFAVWLEILQASSPFNWERFLFLYFIKEPVDSSTWQPGLNSLA